ncbi:MAG: hypothetical protein FWH28_02395 [Clostridiales bacterium]|nr:hypothetical protein [Clostridiales bacterium]
MYDNAEKYLRDVLHGRFDPKKMPPVTKWKSEIVNLTAERKLIEADYYKLRNEVKEAEQIRKSIYSIVRAEQQRTQPHRAHNIDL